MCLFGRAPEWEEDVSFANRRHGRKHRTRVTETTISRTPKYAPPPRRSPSPIIRPTSPPKPPTVVPSPPTPPEIGIVSVEEDKSTTTGPRSSRVSVTKKTRHGSRGGEEVYIERERVRERISPPEPEYDTFRYVEAPMPPRVERRFDEGEERVERKRTRSITYQTNPRTSGRLIERERVVVEDGGRRREYYRKP